MYMPSNSHCIRSYTPAHMCASVMSVFGKPMVCFPWLLYRALRYLHVILPYLENSIHIL